VASLKISVHGISLYDSVSFSEFNKEYWLFSSPLSFSAFTADFRICNQSVSFHMVRCSHGIRVTSGPMDANHVQWVRTQRSHKDIVASLI
jgi:hypothetical protein